MSEDLLIRIARFAACSEKLSIQTKEQMVLTVLFLSREDLNEAKIKSKIRSIFGCTISLEEIRQIISSLCKADKVICIDGCCSLRPDTYHLIKSKSEMETTEGDRFLNKWVEHVIAPQYEELNDSDIRVLKSNLNAFLHTLLEKANESELENKELKKDVSHEKQRNEQLKRQLEKLKAENAQSGLLTKKNMDEMAVMREKTKEMEEKIKCLQAVKEKQVLVIKTFISAFVILITSLLDMCIISRYRLDWGLISKAYKTFIICSFPLSASLISIVFFGTKKGGKFFSAVCAGISVIIGVYKCF